nr:SPOR domain-containing protein [Massilia brevitalea]
MLAANALLFAYGRGLLGSADGELREPARLTKQLAADKLVLLSGEQAQALAAAAKAEDGAAEAETEVEEAPAPAPPAPETPAYACLETEAFAPPDARRFENRLARLELGARQMRLAVPFQEVTSHLVYLPPNGGKEGAERRVAELRERGISDYFIMQGDSPMRWAVSLGAFKTEASARTLAAELAKKGVQGVRVLPRGPQSNRFAYRFRDIDGPTRARILEAGRGMEATILHICK